MEKILSQRSFVKLADGNSEAQADLNQSHDGKNFSTFLKSKKDINLNLDLQ